MKPEFKTPPDASPGEARMLLNAQIESIFLEVEHMRRKVMRHREGTQRMDDAAIDRVISRCSEHLDFMKLMRKQNDRWLSMAPASAWNDDFKSCAPALETLSTEIRSVLAFARELRDTAIARIAALDELESEFRRSTPAAGGSAADAASLRARMSARRLDAAVARLRKNGYDDSTLMGQMYDFMPEFEELMELVGGDGFSRMTVEFPNLAHYVRILVAQAATLAESRTRSQVN